MQEILFGTMLGFLIVMQWFIIWECVKMKSHISGETMNVRTEMANLGSLLDEALDFIADMPTASEGIVSQFTPSGDDLKSVLLNSFMSRMMSPPEHAPQKQEERQVLQDNEPQTQE